LQGKINKDTNRSALPCEAFFFFISYNNEMNWLYAALLGQFFLGISFVFDKIIIKRRTFNARLYAFWAQILSGISFFILVPFGFGFSQLDIVLYALAAGAVFAYGIFFLFKSLELSEASLVQPASVAFAQIFTFIISMLFLRTYLGFWETAAFVLLFLGGLFFLSLENKALRPKLFLFLLASAFFFGLSNVLSKMVFSDAGFISGFLWMRIGGILAVLPFLLFRSFIAEFRSNLTDPERKNKFAYVGNRALAAFGFILVQYSISLSHPALVDATSSFKFAVTFIFAVILIRESFAGKALILKISGTVIVSLGLFLLSLLSFADSLQAPDNNRYIVWGLTFSQKAARDMGADPMQIFEDILRDIKPKKVRLIAYWDELEKGKGMMDFSFLDKELGLAEKYNAEVILAVGLRMPRWPECHAPAWARDLPPGELHDYLKRYMSELVLHYKNNKNIVLWQVENEPFLLFGECPARPKNFLKDEIAFVRSLDNSRPILTTDGGELGVWFRASREGDIFGSTMYRRVYPRFIGPIFGLIDYPLSPGYFQVKEKLVKWWTRRPDQKFIIVELQAEPWAPKGVSNTPYEELVESFSPEFFKETIEYAKDTGFDEYYLWGAEWWWQLKFKKNDPRYWNIAKDLFKSN